MNTGFQLFQLQEIDTGIDNATRRINEIDRKINDENHIIKAKKTLESLEEKYHQHRSSFNLMNDDIQSKKNKRSQSESSLYGGTIGSPKELQDLQKEIESLSAYISKSDDELINKLMELESVEFELDDSKKNLKRILSDFETQKALLNGEKNQLNHSIENQIKVRETVISQMNHDLVKTYEALRQAKSGVAVARLVENACSSCGASLTASQCQQTRSQSSLFYCPSCGRILYGS
jgi:predicted  nucleic acid-binding Zn-ribbon protein